MTINVPPVAVSSSSAAHLRDGNKSASVPDFFHEAALKLLDIAQDYRESGRFINHASTACNEGKSAALYNALFNIRAFTRRMEAVTREIEHGLDDFRADDIDDCQTVYAP